MNKFLFGTCLLCIVMTTISCDSDNKTPSNPEQLVENTDTTHQETATSTGISIAKMPGDFIPEGFVLFDQIKGDLNKDGRDDWVLIIKGTDESRKIEDEYLGSLDRNRRGIIALLDTDGGYQMTLRNDTCFTSENEDGGVYFPPELGVYIEDGKLFFHYAHGRYGFWKYTFRYDKGDFNLIGYDQSDNQGPITHYLYSYNFLTGKKLTKENVNFYSETPDIEVYKETWKDLENTDPIHLSTIKDIDELRFE